MNKSELLNAIVDSCEFKEWLEHQLISDDFIQSVGIDCFYCNGFNFNIAYYLECELDSEQAYDDAFEIVQTILGAFNDEDLEYFYDNLKGEYHLSALDLSKYADHFEDMFSALLVDCVKNNESELVDHFTCQIDNYVEDCINREEDMCGPQARAWQALRGKLICDFESDIENIGSRVDYELIQVLNSIDYRYYDDCMDYFDNVYTKIYDELA